MRFSSNDSLFAQIWGGFEELRTQKFGFCEVGYQPIFRDLFLVTWESLKHWMDCTIKTSAEDGPILVSSADDLAY